MVTKVGPVYRLNLEKFDDNPQLESGMQFNDCYEFDLAFFYNVSQNQKTEEEQKPGGTFNHHPLSGRQEA